MKKTPFSVVGRPLTSKGRNSTSGNSATPSAKPSMDYLRQTEMDNRYIKNLQHQIYLLELELKQGQEARTRNPSEDLISGNNPKTTSQSNQRRTSTFGNGNSMNGSLGNPLSNRQFEKEKMEYEDKIAFLQLKLKDVESLAQEKEMKIIEMKESFQIERQTITNERAQLKSDLEKMKRMVETNQFDEAKYDKKIESLVQEIASQKVIQDELKSELLSTKEQTHEVHEQLKQSEHLLHQSTNKLNDVRTKCRCGDYEIKEKEIINLQATVDQLEIARKQDELLRKHTENEIKDILASNREMTGQLADLRKRVKTQSDFEQSLQLAHDKVEEKENQIQDLAEQNRKLKEHIQTLETSQSDLQLRIHKLSTMQEQLKQDNTQLSTEKKQLNERCLELSDQQYSSNLESRSLIEDIARLQNEIELITTKLSESEDIVRKQIVHLKRLEAYKQLSHQLLNTVDELQKQEKSQTMLMNALRSTLESGFQLETITSSTTTDKYNEIEYKTA